MTRYLSSFPLLWALAGTLAARSAPARHTLEFDSAGVFPVSGYKADEYSAGPGLRVGYELRLQRYLAAEAGWTGAWLPVTSCDPRGCFYQRFENKLLDYELRGVLPLAADRVELSVGLGGGYIWFDKASGDAPYSNSALFQYSVKATVALDRRKRFRLALGLRTWRDLGRPTQQWLATTAGISYGFGAVR